jgi:hypothetical protein
MASISSKLKPANGYGWLANRSLLALLPLAVFILVRLQFVQLALSIIILSKWRMFAVRPRFWPAHIRANAVDLIVGVSILIFMVHTTSIGLQLVWVLLYAIWLIGIKPLSSQVMVSAQAAIGQLVGLMALYLAWDSGPLFGLVLLTGLICYLAARHFFDSFDEAYAKLLSYFWGYFGAAIAWVLGHWLLFYGVVSQPTLFLTTLGYGLAVLYYFDHNDKLSRILKRQFVFVMVAIIIVILTFSGWGNKVV